MISIPYLTYLTTLIVPYTLMQNGVAKMKEPNHSRTSDNNALARRTQARILGSGSVDGCLLNQSVIIQGHQTPSATSTIVG